MKKYLGFMLLVLTSIQVNASNLIVNKFDILCSEGSLKFERTVHHGEVVSQKVKHKGKIISNERVYFELTSRRVEGHAEHLPYKQGDTVAAIQHGLKKAWNVLTKNRVTAWYGYLSIDGEDYVYEDLWCNRFPIIETSEQ